MSSRIAKILLSFDHAQVGGGVVLAWAEVVDDVLSGLCEGGPHDVPVGVIDYSRVLIVLCAIWCHEYIARLNGVGGDVDIEDRWT